MAAPPSIGLPRLSGAKQSGARRLRRFSVASPIYNRFIHEDLGLEVVPRCGIALREQHDSPRSDFERRLNLPGWQNKFSLCTLSRRGSQVVRHGSAKAAFVGSIPTLASKFNQLELRNLENFHR
jgi:hypothetical protein